MKTRPKKIITFPELFTLNENDLNKTVKSLNKITRYKNCTVYLDFSQIHESENSVILILVAQLEKSVIERGNSFFRKFGLPKRKSIRKLLTQVNEIAHQNDKISVNDNKSNERNSEIKLTAIDYATKLTRKIGIKDYQHDLYIVIQEIMANAVEHGMKQKNINWWMTHEVIHNPKRVKYTFLDMGMGITKSYKKSGIPFKYRFRDDRYIIIDALFGRLGSSTKQNERGEGLPQIRDYVELEFIEDFHLITNTVSLRYQNRQFVIDKNPNFRGTYFSFTISKQSIQTWKN